jgi:alkanesulfonate monooxygenase SsuD/methylene tetrahydromethanopterin reductase-like flavin-dependent oxidoreductase (luciferase family)
MGLGGPLSYVVDRIGQLVEMGVDYFMIGVPMPEREIFATEVMPPLRALRN